MRPRRVASMLAFLVSGCTQPDATVEYESYSGPPVYPDKRPKLPAPRGYFGYVSNRGADTITVVDLPGLEVVAEVPIGRDPVSIDAPRNLVVDGSGNLYTALSYPPPTPLPGPHAKHTTSVRNGFIQKLAADDLRVLGEPQIDPSPGDIALSPDGSKLVVTHFDLSRALDAKLSADEQKATLKVIDPVMLTGPSMRLCRAPNGVAFGPDGRTVFVACNADDTIAVVDTTSLAAPRAVLPAGCKGPSTAEASPSRKLVAVACSQDTRLVDTEAASVAEKSLATEGAAFSAGWSPDESKLYVPTQTPDALIVFEVSTRKVLLQRVFEAASCLRPRQALLAKDGATLYLICEGDHVNVGSLLALDPTTLETKASVKVGVFPDRLAFGRVP